MLHEYVGEGNVDELAEELDHVLWLGGSSCSGKTAIARMLADRYGLRSYHCDAHFHAHVDRIDPVRHPFFNRIKDRSPEDLLMRPAQEQAEEFFAFYDEEFQMVLEDLLEMRGVEPVLAEGAGLRPRRVASLLRRPGQAIWLAASVEHRQDVYSRERAKLLDEILSQCEDPRTAFENWMARDELRTKMLIEETRALNLLCLTVDGSQSLVANAREVAKHFGLHDGIDLDGIGAAGSS